MHAQIIKTLFRKFSSRHRSTLSCSNCVRFDRREICEIMRYLPDQKTTTKFQLTLKLLLLCRSCPKSARASPQQCRPTQSAPDFIQIGLLSAEL